MEACSGFRLIPSSRDFHDLHHVYGIPYIPGSAIKGMTRHWFILREFEKQNLSIEQIKCFERSLMKLISEIKKTKKPINQP